MALLVDIEKNLGDFQLKVAFEAADETLALLGASGCGKSLTLRCIAGIEKPDKGRIVLNGVTLFDSDKGINLPPQQRRTGLMFQNYALFPNMTVEQNILAGAKREKDPAKRRETVAAVMDSFGLTQLAHHYPRQLSGGQQQRTALARMLVSDPEILLLDEPFSALDSHLRYQLEQEVRQVIRRFGKTVLLVSHDRHEVYRMADSIAVMNRGRVETVGAKAAVYADPKTKSGAILTGCKNISRAQVLDEGHVRALDWGITLTVPVGGRPVTAVGIRSHTIAHGPGENHFSCAVTDVVENPFSLTTQVRVQAAESGKTLGWELPTDRWQTMAGDRVEIHLPAAAILLLHDEKEI
jgi:molybdate transport system ATP-binding protein